MSVPDKYHFPLLIEKTLMNTGTKLGPNFQINDKTRVDINIIQWIILNVLDIMKITLKKQVGDFVKGFMIIMIRKANLTWQNISLKITINLFLLKISLYFKITLLIANLRGNIASVAH